MRSYPIFFCSCKCFSLISISTFTTLVWISIRTTCIGIKYRFHTILKWSWITIFFITWNYHQWIIWITFGTCIRISFILFTIWYSTLWTTTCRRTKETILTTNILIWCWYIISNLTNFTFNCSTILINLYTLINWYISSCTSCCCSIRSTLSCFTTITMRCNEII